MNVFESHCKYNLTYFVAKYLLGYNCLSLNTHAKFTNCRKTFRNIKYETEVAALVISVHLG